MSIKEIKAKLGILTVLSHYGLSPDKNKMIRCPFHEDQKASMKVYVETGTVYCFAGSCKQSSLDVIDFIMQIMLLPKIRASGLVGKNCKLATDYEKETQNI